MRLRAARVVGFYSPHVRANFADDPRVYREAIGGIRGQATYGQDERVAVLPLNSRRELRPHVTPRKAPAEPFVLPIALETLVVEASDVARVIRDRINSELI